MTETLSAPSSKAFASYDPSSSSWRTYPDSGKAGSPEFSGAFPRWGFMRDGIAFELPKPAHLTEENASLSLPTPRTTDANGAGLHGSGGKDLRTAVKLLPTPTTRNLSGNQANNRGDLLLPGVAIKLLPTPNTGQSPNGHGTRGGKAGNGRQSGADLEAVVKLLPTPTARDSKGADKKQSLLEPKVLSIGANMRQQSDDKNTSSAV